MEHKLKKGITVIREFAPDVPKVTANGGELNQIWTNLIDNAADAMKDKGKLRVRVSHEGNYVLVESSTTAPAFPKTSSPISSNHSSPRKASATHRPRPRRRPAIVRKIAALSTSTPYPAKPAPGPHPDSPNM